MSYVVLMVITTADNRQQFESVRFDTRAAADQATDWCRACITGSRSIIIEDEVPSGLREV